jgi:hypothetical protein
MSLAGNFIERLVMVNLHIGLILLRIDIAARHVRIMNAHVSHISYTVGELEVCLLI